MSLHDQWRDKLTARFSERTPLTTREIAQSVDPPLSEADVDELARVIRDEFGVDLGVMRFNDHVDSLVTHPSSGGNPLAWLVFESASRDATNELHSRLAKRLKHFETERDWPRVQTIEELLLAWCGRRRQQAP